MCQTPYVHMPTSLPQQQMEMMPRRAIGLDCLQIKVWTVSPKGQIWETNWNCQEPMDRVICLTFMTRWIKKADGGKSAAANCSCKVEELDLLDLKIVLRGDK